MADTIYKPIQSLVSAKQENSTLQTVNGSGLTFTLCDRTDLASKEANYFVSFNLPFETDAFASGSTASKSSPELQQLNADRIVICPLDPSIYSETFDGRSFTFKVPQQSGATASTSFSSKTIVSSTYSTFQKRQDSSLLGKNIAFLFSDDLNVPFSGTTNGVSHATNTTWNTSSYLNRPAAVSYSDLKITDLNTDKRPFSTVNQAIEVGEEYPTETNRGYNYDIPVGFAALDKGFMVLTHPDIVNNIPWTSGQTLYSNYLNSGSTSATTNIYFTDTTNSTLSVRSLDTTFKTVAICLALPGEFFLTNNPTWDMDKNMLELQNSTNNFDSIYVTEIGLYNIKNELIAIAKIDRPTEKNFTNIITFNLEIDV